MGTVPPKGKADYLALGDWNAACSVCGRKFKASTMKQLPAGVGGPWGGETYTCTRCWRPRQAQDFVRGVPDKMAPPWTQPEVDNFLFTSLFCTETSDPDTMDPMTYFCTEDGLHLFQTEN